jgi:type I restriction enzyme, S subunit
MKNEWQTQPLANVCEIKPPKSEARQRVAADALVSFAPMEDLGIDRKFLNATQVKPLASVVRSYTYFADGDVLLAKITPCFENGKLGIATGLKNRIGFGSSEFIVFRPGANLAKEYLYYYLSRPEFRIEGAALMGGAVGQQRVPKEFIEKYPIPFPSLHEQRHIVGILDEAFDGIATAKANAEKNLQNARALFESHLQSVFTRGSTGWTETTLDDVCQQITDGKHGDCKDEAGSGFYFLSAKDVKAGTLNYEKARQITKQDFEETHRRTNLEPGDILITNAGTIGRMGVAPSDDKTTRTTFQKSVAILKLVKETIDSKFAFYCLSAGLTRFVILSAGTAQKNLLLRDLRGYRFALPNSIDQQRVVATRLDSLSQETQRLESIYQQKLVALDALKKSLLHQAFSGQL